MKTLKIWEITFAILVAFALASCSSDEEDYHVDHLTGTWERVYNESTLDAGTERYTFSPESSSTGHIALYVNSWMWWGILNISSSLQARNMMARASSMVSTTSINLAVVK